MDFDVLLAECAPWVAPQTMSAIVRTESQFNPLVININAKTRLVRQPVSKQEAAVTAKWLIGQGYNIDVGLGQVNSANLEKANLSIDDAFDPCKNLSAAATILRWNYESAIKRIPQKQQALYAAISAYNTGSMSRGFQNGYVQKVLVNAQKNNYVHAENHIGNMVSPIDLVSVSPPLMVKPLIAKNAAAKKKAIKRGIQPANDPQQSKRDEVPEQEVMKEQSVNIYDVKTMRDTPTGIMVF